MPISYDRRVTAAKKACSSLASPESTVAPGMPPPRGAAWLGPGTHGTHRCGEDSEDGQARRGDPMLPANDNGIIAGADERKSTGNGQCAPSRLRRRRPNG